jgi:hypothetical protein
MCTSSDTTSSASIESALAAEEPIESRLCAPHNRYRDGAPPPGIFWLFSSIFAPPVRSDRFAVRNHNLNHGAIKPTMAFSL